MNPAGAPFAPAQSWMSIDVGDDPAQVIVGFASFAGGAADEVVPSSNPLADTATKATKAIKLLQLLSEDFLAFILFFLLLAGFNPASGCETYKRKPRS